jgi:hypothetical protein
MKYDNFEGGWFKLSLSRIKISASYHYNYTESEFGSNKEIYTLSYYDGRIVYMRPDTGKIWFV